MNGSARVLKILLVHSSAELYGSDRSLLDFVRNCGAGFHLTVALPESGALVQELERAGARVVVGDVCKISREMRTLSGLRQVFGSIRRTLGFLGAVHKQACFDLVYSNTVAVLGGAFFARRAGIPHVWHVREIVAGSGKMTFAFRWLVAMLSAKVVCNSAHTLEWVRLAGAASKYRVVWNGFDAPVIQMGREAARAQLGIPEDVLLFVLVGRINAWKGQSLLVEAFAKLRDETVPAHLAIVGSAPSGQAHHEQALVAFVAESGCADRIRLLPYREDVAPVWAAADVAVVPSTEPEPFGRVAIEAMGFGLPVIAAAHGGLVEIVVDGETGRLVKPRDADALASALLEMVRDADLRRGMGSAGQTRQRALFSVKNYAQQMRDVLRMSVTRRT